MKIIILKTGEFNYTDPKTGVTEKKTISTRELISSVLNSPLDKGFVFQDLQNRIRIEKNISACEGDELSLEDADYNNLKGWANQVRWLYRSEFLYDFLLQFNS